MSEFEFNFESSELFMTSDLEFDPFIENNFSLPHFPVLEELIAYTPEIYCQKKRGRRPCKNGNYKTHDKNSEDNIIRKIQISYINFIINFVNKILKAIGRQDLSFVQLAHNYKKNINKKNRNILNSLTIKEIISNNISRKFKKKEIDFNKKICEQIEKESQYKILQSILSKNFLFFFDKIYYKNIKKINMKEFGFDDLEIDLENIELFGDLLSKEKDDNNLKEKMHFCAKNYFLPKNKNEKFQCIYY